MGFFVGGDVESGAGVGRVGKSAAADGEEAATSITAIGDASASTSALVRIVTFFFCPLASVLSSFFSRE